MSRHEALKRWFGRQIIDDLADRGIAIRSPSSRGVAEEAPGAYKDVTKVVEAADGPRDLCERLISNHVASLSFNQHRRNPP